MQDLGSVLIHEECQPEVTDEGRFLIFLHYNSDHQVVCGDFLPIDYWTRYEFGDSAFTTCHNQMTAYVGRYIGTVTVGLGNHRRPCYIEFQPPIIQDPTML